jgi:hypothetical protein
MVGKIEYEIKVGITAFINQMDSSLKIMGVEVRKSSNEGGEPV